MKTEKTVAIFNCTILEANYDNRTFTEKELNFLGSFDRNGNPVCPKEYKEAFDNAISQNISKAKLIMNTVFDNGIWFTFTDVVAE